MLVMASITVNINPNILIWARQELGYKLAEVAESLKKDQSQIKQWETDGQSVKFTDLQKLAKLYKRQTAVFFMNETPVKANKPKDYRNLGLKSKGLGHDALLTIRRTKRYLQLYRELHNQEFLNEQYRWLNEFNGNNDRTETLRSLLNVTIKEQRLSKNKKFKFWRDRIESKLNIFVFQFPLEKHVFDGFSYIEDGKPYGITINSRITENRKIFTLFHELAHIIEGHAGICITSGNSNNFQLETRCNQFAANFLMPRDEMIRPNNFDDLETQASSLGVSKEAYTIRLKDLSLISEVEFKSFMAKISIINAKILADQKAKAKDKDGFVPRDTLSKSRRGDKFFDFVLDAYGDNRISSSTAKDVLELKLVGLGRNER